MDDLSPKMEVGESSCQSPSKIYVRLDGDDEKHWVFSRSGESYGCKIYNQAMIRGLNKASWERVDVSFHKSRQRLLAHTAIQVKTYSINYDGADVIFHMIDNFLP